MSAPFIDATGFNTLGLNGWLALLQAQYQSVYGTGIDITEASPDGIWLGIMAGNYANLEQLAHDVYLGRAPAGAVGAALSRLVQLNGANRKAAQFSTAPVTLSGTPGTVIPAGSLVASATDPTKPSWATTGVSPTDDKTIGGGGTVAAQVQCTVSGPISAIAGELTMIQTIISGWTAVTNTADAAPGLAVEADPALRIRRAASVALPSQSMLDGLEAALLDLPGVTDARCYENTTAATDSKGLPAHSFDCIVLGGVDADIANVIWTKGGMGATRVGAHSLDVVDIQGNPQTQRWDTPSDVDAYIIVKLDRSPTNLAFLGTQIAAEIVAYYSVDGDLPARIGQNIAWGDLFTPINNLGLVGRPGLPSITQIFLGSAPSPVLQTDLIVPYNALAVFDTSRISVVGP